MSKIFLVLDLETDFAHTKIDLAGFYNPTGGHYYFHTNADDTRARLKSYLSLYDEVTFVTWNGSRFDLPMLAKVWGINLMHPKVSHVDGMLMSKLLCHGRKGGHSLGNVAKSFFPADPSKWKSEVDFAEATEAELAAYCKQDCQVTWEVVKHMLLSNDWKRNDDKLKVALKMEQDVAYLVQEQVDKEVFFDIGKGMEIYKTIINEMAEIEEEVHPKLPRIPLKPSELHYPPKKQFKKDGTVSALMTGYCDKYGLDIHKASDDTYYVMDEERGESYKLPFTDPVVKDKELVLDNQIGLKQWLLDKGWQPTQYNYKFVEGKKVETSARMTDKVTKEPCPNLKHVGIDFMPDISRWLMLRSRKNILKSNTGTGWIPRAIASFTSTMPSDADSMGANTSRWTHKGIANVPRVSSPYGQGIRSCFAARPSKVWVGWDASALEACVEAHYTYKYDGGAYAKEIMEGDVHTKNKEALGLPDRDTAKTFKYAITYGAQASTLSKTLRSSVAHAEKIYDGFWKANPALSALKRDLEKEWELSGKKWITGLDGRKVSTRSKHSLLNALFQSAGAIIMKKAMLLANQSIYDLDDADKENTYGLIRYHDEEIWETDEELAGMVGSRGVHSISDAGDFYHLNVGLSAEYKVGKNWAEVH